MAMAVVAVLSLGSSGFESQKIPCVVRGGPSTETEQYLLSTDTHKYLLSIDIEMSTVN
jgi:hypothetical protein